MKYTLTVLATLFLLIGYAQVPTPTLNFGIASHMR